MMLRNVQSFIRGQKRGRVEIYRKAFATATGKDSHLIGSSNEPLIEETTYQLLERKANENTSKDALRSVEQDLRFTYEELLQHTKHLATGLNDARILKGKKLTTKLATYTPESLITGLAAGRGGFTQVIAPPSYNIEQVGNVLQATNSRGLIIPPSDESNTKNDNIYEMRDLIPELRYHTGEVLRSRRFPDLKTIISTGDQPEVGFSALFRQIFVTHPLPDPLESVQVSSNDTVTIAYDTDFVPAGAGAMFSHHKIVNNSRFFAKTVGFESSDRVK